MKRLLALVVLALAAVVAPGFSPAAFADAPITARFVNDDGRHCGDNGTASRGFIAVRTKDSLSRGAITAVSDVWTQTSVVGARNSWLVRLKGPRAAPASMVRVVTPIGSVEVSVPAFDAPCPVTPRPVSSQLSSGAGNPAVLGVDVPGGDAKPVVKPVVTSAPRTTTGSLPFTGVGTIQLLPVAALCLCLGTLMLAGPRRRSRPEALRYDGRFLADG